MKKPHALIGLLAAVGTAIGVIVAIFGLPYGRLNYTAFAGLYHNGTPFASVQAEVDCDGSTSGVQSTCTINTTSVAAIPVDVVMSNFSGSGTQIDSFNYDLFNDQCKTGCVQGDTGNPAGGIGPSVPVQDSTNFPANYGCASPPPSADTSSSPLQSGTSTSFLSCVLQSGTATALPDGGSVRLSGESFSDNVTAATSIVLTLSNLASADDNAVTTISCDPNAPPPASPEGNVVGPCFPATLNFVVPPPATDTPVPPTNTPVPPTNTPVPTNTPTNTPTATNTPSGINQDKVCDPDGAPVNNTNGPNGPACNLFICQVGPCDGPNEGDLVVLENVINVAPGLGAYEFNVEFDSFVIASVNPMDVVFSPGGAGANRGPADCSMTINSENGVRFGCVTKGATPAGPTGSFTLAKLDLVPAADDVKDLFPGNDNGIPTLIKDNQCELADVLGHPMPGAGNGTGQLSHCGDIYVTVRILEGDLNLDCKVDVLDEALIASHYGAFFGSAFYQKWFDLEPKFHDLDIDIKDLQKVFGRDGSTCQNPIPDQTPVPPPFNLNS